MSSGMRLTPMLLPGLALCMTLCSVAGLMAGCGETAGVLPAAEGGHAELLPVYEDPGLTPHWLTAEQLLVAKRQFPEFSLRDQSGLELTRADLEGRIVVADFFFTGCSDLCPRLRSGMAALRDAFPGDPDLLLLSHTVAPEADSVPMLAAYARTNGIDGRRWHLLTGPRSVIEHLEFDGYLIPRPPPAAGRALHSELFVLLDRHQRVRGVYNATLQTELNFLLKDIRALHAEEPG
jgi:protein SCO1/2